MKNLLQGDLEQTHERKQYVQQHPLSQLCEHQMQQGNYIQPACRNMTARANYMDHYNFNVEYHKVNFEINYLQ